MVGYEPIYKECPHLILKTPKIDTSITKQEADALSVEPVKFKESHIVETQPPCNRAKTTTKDKT